MFSVEPKWMSQMILVFRVVCFLIFYKNKLFFTYFLTRKHSHINHNFHLFTNRNFENWKNQLRSFLLGTRNIWKNKINETKMRNSMGYGVTCEYVASCRHRNRLFTWRPSRMKYSDFFLSLFVVSFFVLSLFPLTLSQRWAVDELCACMWCEFIACRFFLFLSCAHILHTHPHGQTTRIHIQRCDLLVC